MEESVLRTYETLYIIHPDTSEDEVQAISQQVEALVQKHGGEIVKGEIWGKRRLAYEVRKCTEGYYVLLRFTAPADFVQRLEAHFRLAENIIRFLTTYFDEHTLALEERQRKRKEAEIRNSVAGEGRRGRDDDSDDRRPSRGRSRRDDDDDDDDDDED